MSAPSAITGRTAVLGILADPVAQARSPQLVNAALAARGHDAVMVPLQVAAGDLERAVDGLRAWRSFRGAVVSMPHKSAIVALLDDATAEVRQTLACNAVRREPDGRLVGAMFDGAGFVAGLRHAGHEVRGKRVLLLGAGGAAAGIAFALAAAGVAALAIRNRTPARAAALAVRVQQASPDVEVAAGAASARGFDLVVNATSLGMQGGDPLPLPFEGVAPQTIAADVVLRPEPTPFLAAAASRGCVIHPGEAMLAAQIELLLDFILG